MRTEGVAEQRRGVEDTSGVQVEFHMMPGQEPWIDFTFEGRGAQFSEEELREIGEGSVLLGAIAVKQAFGEIPDATRRASVMNVATTIVRGFLAQEGQLAGRVE
ncbi:MAG: hypothetical protein A3A51_02600 [Candidatus Levybacteria bacterium RIFCSPLOWO2_01_FULL_39_10]|nr:MAG: hypothetical protein A3A51_02600 [Candidatus Levybacteria bacterium RIFCSPLOWO2_01_FULL_39_10]